MASRLIPGYETENTSELVTFLELDEVLRNPKDHPTEQIYESTSRLASQIRSNMAESRAVVVRGWNRDLPSDFTHESLALHVGDLGQPAQWGDGMIIARNRDLPEPVSYHKTSSLEEFVSRIDLTDVCGNWLDGKNVHPTPPFFSIPILDSTMAWNHTFRILCESKQKNHTINHAQSPETVRAANWSAPGWRLVTHPGFLTWPHFDCCGFATYVVAEEGCKLWGVMRPRAEECNSEWKKVPELYQKIQVTGQDGRYPCDMEVIVLERGDVLWVSRFFPQCDVQLLFVSSFILHQVPATQRDAYGVHTNTIHLHWRLFFRLWNNASHSAGPLSTQNAGWFYEWHTCWDDEDSL